MCNLMKCCVNCKYYEHISVLDDEAEWCHCPNHQGIISNDPNYVKSELSGECEHYERLENKQNIAPPTPSQDKTELKVGDRVYVSKTEGKASYGYILYCKGTIKDITFEPFYNRTTYKVKIDDKTNKYQEDGLFIFHKSKSLININQCENKTIKVDDSEEMLEDLYAKIDTAYTKLSNNKTTSKPQKEINEKIARKIMMNSVYGKTVGYSDPICTEPSIVDHYINKKRATYEKEREDAIQKVYDASPIGKAITNFIAALKKAGLKDEMLPNFNMLWNDNCLTDAEKAAINEIHTEYHLAMTKLHDKCRDCVAILVNCETFEQKMTILQKYDIIDSDYKLKA